jgi:signal transduction histidine kinase
MEAMANSPTVQRRLTVRTSWNGNGEVEVAVTDRGPGIAPEHLHQLFDSFFTTKKRGVGLGLSIARSIVAAHGGRIWAESDPGYGATFRLALPAGNVESTPKKGV